MRIKVHKGDTVQIRRGKDRGKTGQVERVFPKNATVVVAGLNLVKKHQKASRKLQQAGIISFPAPLPIARVAVVCPSCHKPTRVGIQIDSTGRRERVCRHCHEVIGAKES